MRSRARALSVALSVTIVVAVSGCTSESFPQAPSTPTTPGSPSSSNTPVSPDPLGSKKSQGTPDDAKTLSVDVPTVDPALWPDWFASLKVNGKPFSEVDARVIDTRSFTPVPLERADKKSERAWEYFLQLREEVPGRAGHEVFRKFNYAGELPTPEMGDQLFYFDGTSEKPFTASHTVKHSQFGRTITRISVNSSHVFWLETGGESAYTQEWLLFGASLKDRKTTLLAESSKVTGLINMPWHDVTLRLLDDHLEVSSLYNREKGTRNLIEYAGGQLAQATYRISFTGGLIASGERASGWIEVDSASFDDAISKNQKVDLVGAIARVLPGTKNELVMEVPTLVQPLPGKSAEAGEETETNSFEDGADFEDSVEAAFLGVTPLENEAWLIQASQASFIYRPGQQLLVMLHKPLLSSSDEPEIAEKFNTPNVYASWTRWSAKDGYFVFEEPASESVHLVGAYDAAANRGAKVMLPPSSLFLGVSDGAARFASVLEPESSEQTQSDSEEDLGDAPDANSILMMEYSLGLFDDAR